MLIVIFSIIRAHSQVQINEQAEITRAMEFYKTKAQTTDYVEGWRIQLINTDNRRQMESARARFSSKYPYLKMTWEHVQPYYQVRVGAYKDKIELEGFLRELKYDFPRAIPVRDKVYKSELSL